MLLSRSFFGMQLSFISRERLFLASATHEVKAQVRPSFRGGDARARGKSG